MSAMLDELAAKVAAGKAKIVPGLVQEALDAGEKPVDCLNTMIGAMDVVGERFKNNEIFVPEMLIAAKAMKKGVEVLKPLLAEEGTTNAGSDKGTDKWQSYTVNKRFTNSHYADRKSRKNSFLQCMIFCFDVHS